ncbi:MAG: hypothetical protein RLZZ301_742 [Bacteroidota bacterium]|jgi:hypothetical protein
MIGKDFDKIEWNVAGFHFLEPNALVGDVCLFLLSMYLYKRMNQFDPSHFNTYWKRFYLFFGIGFLMGGFGHFLFHYWGVPGKYASWFIGMVATLQIELAFISDWKNEQQLQRLRKLAYLKFLVFCLIECYVLYTTDLSIDQSKGLKIPSLDSAIGLIFSLGFLARIYHKQRSVAFRYFNWALFIMIPIAFIIELKINLHPYFDRNDFSHVLLGISLLIYFQGIRKVSMRTA